MWSFVDEPAAPQEFLVQVLPRVQETYLGQYNRAYAALEQGASMREAGAWAMADGKPVGMASVSGGESPELFVAVGEAWRGRGVGAGLVEEVCAELRQQGVQRLAVSDVSSANAAAVQLLQATGFVGLSMGSLRMRRSLDAPVPACDIAPGYALRTLAKGEEAAYVRLKNTCFPESSPWTEEDFPREFPPMSFNAYERIVVAEREEQLVGTASAWEIDYGGGPLGLLHWVGVDPAHRGQGLGAALNVRALQKLKACGYAEVWLNTSRERMAAVRLYERLGFVPYQELYTYTLTL